MEDGLRAIETPYVDTQTLLVLFADYQRSRERILRLINNGKLIRLKNGFYLIANKIGQASRQMIPYEQVANRL